jgi:hypothetical protein
MFAVATHGCSPSLSMSSSRRGWNTPYGVAVSLRTTLRNARQRIAFCGSGAVAAPPSCEAERRGDRMGSRRLGAVCAAWLLHAVVPLDHPPLLPFSVYPCDLKARSPGGLRRRPPPSPAYPLVVVMSGCRSVDAAGAFSKVVRRMQGGCR